MKRFKFPIVKIFMTLFVMGLLVSFTPLDRNTTDDKVVSVTNFKNSEIVSETRYYSGTDSDITITYNRNTRELLSIEDSANSIPQHIIDNAIANVNGTSVYGCGCAWYDVWCQAMCALCEGLGGEDCNIE